VSATVPRRDDVMHLGPIRRAAEAADALVAVPHDCPLRPPYADVGPSPTTTPEDRPLTGHRCRLPSRRAGHATGHVVCARVDRECRPARVARSGLRSARAPSPEAIAARRAVPHAVLILGPVMRDAADRTVAVRTVGGWHGPIIRPKEAEYVAIAEARLNGIPRGLGLGA